MNWLDIVLVLILAFTVITGFAKGFTRQIIGLVTVVAALVLAIGFYGMAGAWLEPHVNSRTVAHLAGFLIVFVGVNLVGALVEKLMTRAVRATGLSFFDHVLGAGFGFLRGLLFAIVLLLVAMAFTTGDKPPAAVVNSRLAPYVVDAARAIAAVAPHEIKTGFRKTYAQVKSAWERAWKQQLGPVRKAKHEREI